MIIMDFINKISKEFGVTPRVAENVIKLLGEGATVPFIARYRKEMTDTMNEETVAEVKKRLEQLDELEKRKVFVLKSIAEQEKLTPGLERQITNAETLQDVEDLYLPYKPKRRTKAEIARQKGLEPLAKLIMSQNSDDVNGLAKRFISKEKEVNNEEEALKGACDIMAEWISENINGRNRIRKIYHRDGIISSTLVKGKEAEAQTYPPSAYETFQQEFSKYKIKDNQDDGFYAKVCQNKKIKIIGLYDYYPGFFHDEIKPINGGSCRIPRWQKQQRFGKPK